MRYYAAIFLLTALVAVLGFAQLGGASLAGISKAPTQQSGFTYVHGSVDMGNLGSALAIYFEPGTGPLTSVVTGTSHTYQLYLLSRKTYQVSIYYDSSDLSGIRRCDAQPGQFSPVGEDSLQDFHC